jgi:hypothetical protein
MTNEQRERVTNVGIIFLLYWLIILPLLLTAVEAAR